MPEAPSTVRPWLLTCLIGRHHDQQPRCRSGAPWCHPGRRLPPVRFPGSGPEEWRSHRSRCPEPGHRIRRSTRRGGSPQDVLLGPRWRVGPCEQTRPEQNRGPPLRLARPAPSARPPEPPRPGRRPKSPRGESPAHTPGACASGTPKKGGAHPAVRLSRTNAVRGMYSVFCRTGSMPGKTTCCTESDCVGHRKNCLTCADAAVNLTCHVVFGRRSIQGWGSP